jgi:protein SCO1
MNQNNRSLLKNVLLSLFASAAIFTGCTTDSNRQLPIYGERHAETREINGQTTVDTVYHQIPEFTFVNQDSQQVTAETFAGKIYVTDFFFTSCPTICPKMKSQMLRVYEEYQDNPNVVLLSHTIDPQHDTVAVLRNYADQLNVNTNKWHFVTGDKDAIYDIAMKYLVPAMEEEDQPGGFTHGGHFILVDENRRIRGIYDGTDAEQVDRLIKDIPVLLNENKHAQK